MKTGRHWKKAALGLSLALAFAAAQAQIVVGETVGVTGAVAATVKEALIGARLYIDWVNATGGIKGEKIDLITLDDHFDVKKAVENTRFLIEEKNAVVLFMDRGTPHTQAIMPLLAKNQIALVAPSTGAMLLHKPVNKYIFNVRAPYQREAAKAIEHLTTLGINRIAVVHVNDAFGADAMEGAKHGFDAARIKPVAEITADRDKPDYKKIVPPIVASKAQAVLWIGSGTAVSEGIKALRAAGSAAQIVTLSNNASEGFIKLMGDAGKGVIVTQVFPYERSYAYPFIQEALQIAKESGVNELSPAILEGFAGAKVLVEALKRAGPHPTRAKVLAALEHMNKFDLGGLEVSYSPTDHTGLQFADLSIIGADGRFRR
ncbi:MAG TPA: ABC transporter substrate-binding protein [Ramlibacter sp.]|nr:ABC transporter substrate-binding protein [Ramlibacter sp.]